MAVHTDWGPRAVHGHAGGSWGQRPAPERAIRSLPLMLRAYGGWVNTLCVKLNRCSFVAF
jgi:hypothetical protein